MNPLTPEFVPAAAQAPAVLFPPQQPQVPAVVFPPQQPQVPAVVFPPQQPQAPVMPQAQPVPPPQPHNNNFHRIPLALLRYLHTKNIDLNVALDDISQYHLLRGSMILADVLSKADIGLNVDPEDLLYIVFNTAYRRLLKFCRGKTPRFIQNRLGHRFVKYRLLFCHALSVLNGCKSLFFLAGYSFKFPPRIADHRSATVFETYQRLTGGSGAFYNVRVVYLRFQAEHGLAQEGLPQVILINQPMQQQQQQQQQQQ